MLRGGGAAKPQQAQKVPTPKRPTRRPTKRPTRRPSKRPTRQPTRQATRRLTGRHASSKLTHRTSQWRSTCTPPTTKSSQRQPSRKKVPTRKQPTHRAPTHKRPTRKRPTRKASTRKRRPPPPKMQTKVQIIAQPTNSSSISGGSSQSTANVPLVSATSLDAIAIGGAVSGSTSPAVQLTVNDGTAAGMTITAVGVMMNSTTGALTVLPGTIDTTSAAVVPKHYNLGPAPTAQSAGPSAPPLADSPPVLAQIQVAVRLNGSNNASIGGEWHSVTFQSGPIFWKVSASRPLKTMLLTDNRSRLFSTSRHNMLPCNSGGYSPCNL